VVLVAKLLSLPRFFPQKLATKIMDEVAPIAVPQTEVTPPKPQSIVRAKVRTQLEAVEPPEPPPPQHVAKLLAPRELVAPKPKPVQVGAQEVPQVNQNFEETNFEAPVSGPAPPERTDHDRNDLDGQRGSGDYR
jgi:hypothetical protein